ncbi:DNA polymerase III subunit gamma/tau [Paraferrimonas haliotis]|uniref:DNA polymerase III subunit gamma/tau n=1 Tax=Paraferrimonas haliotis TaxID=2013866 RepID=A0AA37TW73_9GAMM|nr:DNA polymerase III subunit gamma/tau [Paraferrimonas haliotis]GLS84025.1 hypothetical protein GCM10007894_20020 [Paraferrimonas haliotis]
MSYQVLARKWRPGRFDEVVGQAHVLAALTNALQQDRLHHAYLFSGTRGVGKTTLARLFAKGLNCETGVTSEPCGQCSACCEISEGRFVDLIEVDAASRTKVDDTREILENVQYRPARGRYKVYLIDEVHMLSKASFNALLKTLEEPPEHVKFLLATTDPQKLPITVLSRCLQFNLKALAVEQIAAQIERILTAEAIEFEQGTSLLLARAAQGSMRDGLSLTDQAIAHGAGSLKLKALQHMLGSLDDDSVNQLLQAVIDGELTPLLSVIDDVLGYGGDSESVLVAMLRRLHEISLCQFSESAAQISSHPESVMAFAKALTPEQVQLYYKIVLEGRRELPFAPDQRAGIEMALMRAIAFAPETPVTVWNKSPLQQAEVSPKRQAQPQPELQPEPQPELQPQPEPQPQPQQRIEPVPQPEYQTGPTESELFSEQQNILSQAQTQGLSKPSDTDREEALAPSEPDLFEDDILAAALSNREELLEDISKNVSDDSPKKPETESATSVVERTLSATKPTQSTEQEPTTKPVHPEPVQPEPAKLESTPAEPLTTNDDGHSQLPVEPLALWQLLLDDNQTDMVWYKILSLLNVGGRLRQLAINSVAQRQGERLLLSLKPDQKHLGADKAVLALQQILCDYFEQTITVEVSVVEPKDRETPLMIRRRFHQEILKESQSQLLQQPPVQWLEKHLGAKLDWDSLKYPEHKLTQRV